MDVEKVLIALKKINSNPKVDYVSIEFDQEGIGQVINYDSVNQAHTIIEFDSIKEFYEKAIAYSS